MREVPRPFQRIGRPVDQSLAIALSLAPKPPNTMDKLTLLSLSVSVLIGVLTVPTAQTVEADGARRRVILDGRRGGSASQGNAGSAEACSVRAAPAGAARAFSPDLPPQVRQFVAIPNQFVLMVPPCRMM